MRSPKTVFSIVTIAITCLAAVSNVATAGKPGSRLFRRFFKSKNVNVYPYECDECGQIHDSGTKCIVRYPVEVCVTGKKLVYDSKVQYEYVSIPEVRYRWVKKWVTKEIPADYSKPVCKSKPSENCFGTEKWTKEKQECGTRHCMTVVQNREKAVSKSCDCKPGKTTIKVRYKTCVKEPYTVYRQVKRPICVKYPRYEKVDVAITKYECEQSGCNHCNGSGCKSCLR